MSTVAKVVSAGVVVVVTDGAERASASPAVHADVTVTPWALHAVMIADVCACERRRAERRLRPGGWVCFLGRIGTVTGVVLEESTGDIHSLAMSSSSAVGVADNSSRSSMTVGKRVHSSPNSRPDRSSGVDKKVRNRCRK